MPSMNKCIYLLVDVFIFSTSDANGGYGKVELEGVDRDRNSFVHITDYYDCRAYQADFSMHPGPSKDRRM